MQHVAINTISIINSIFNNNNFVMNVKSCEFVSLRISKIDATLKQFNFNVVLSINKNLTLFEQTLFRLRNIFLG